MKKLFYIFFSAFVLITQIAIAQTQQVPVEIKAPIWVSSRPNTGFKYVGIGFGDKTKGGNYQMEAKKNALYDLTSEIKVDISSNSVLYSVQNNNSFNEDFNSLIKLSNSDNIEGYTLVDSYENDKQYWVYYELDKQQYAEQKALKKRQTIAKASNLIVSSFEEEKNQNFSASLKKRIQAFGVLTPYLSEEINFDASQNNGVKNIFDLTNLIQQQLQSISVAQQKNVPSLKPYQSSYSPLSYSLQLKSKIPLQNFPFLVSSDEEKISVNEKASTDLNGSVQLKINSVEPLQQMVYFSLNPDINTLMGNDSVGRAGITLLKEFIQTSALKVEAYVTNIAVYISSVEKNFGKVTGSNTIDMFIKQRFNGEEVRLVDKVSDADFIIESVTDTKKDISSSVLEKNYNVSLASLSVSLQLKNKTSNEVLYNTQISEIYGYANDLETAGLNAYSSSKFTAKLAEAIFFLKRKILVY